MDQICLFALLVLVPIVNGLDNGLGLTPQMGYSSWNDCGSVVSEDHVKAIAEYMISSGLAAKGYTYVNVDEGWLLGRNSTSLEMIEDRKLFPSGMAALGKFIHDLEVPGKGKIMKYGLYTSRGVQQCDTTEYRARCLHTPPNPSDRCVGSHGWEVQDAQWMVDAGADYIKEDSCGGDQTHSIAFGDYAKFRDALNKSGTQAGRPIFFSLCGWEEWYAPPDPSIGYEGGHTLGNSYRIHGDGSDWNQLSGATNTIAAIGKHSRPGAWADPDLLIGPENKKPMHIGGQTDIQARTQFNLWSVFPAPLLISQNMLTWSDYALQTYSNAKVIAINQDLVVHSPGARLAGGDLSFPCQKGSSSCTNVWGRVLTDQSFALVFVNNADTQLAVVCDDSCFGNLAKVSGVPVNTRAYAVRDLWNDSSQQDVNLATDPAFKADVPGNGSSMMYRFYPKTASTILV
eukprot:TRINITY_DN32000_c0_g1_i1.p1 TRINITY_DN32000_c0_g1~~TRINITY_DN32000_c0_g1_i1.p1  ORF type:complete len:456 (-),score=61.70 TRINITY_DN32000_c0_g1_i1:46-1413(-)